MCLLLLLVILYLSLPADNEKEARPEAKETSSLIFFSVSGPAKERSLRSTEYHNDSLCAFLKRFIYFHCKVRYTERRRDREEDLPSLIHSPSVHNGQS